VTVFIAQAADQIGTNLIAQWGAVGLLLVVGFFVIRWQARENALTLKLERETAAVALKTANDRSDRFEAKCDELTKALIDRVIPAMNAQASAMADLIDRLDRERTT
jgi:hypothetical protein